MSRTPRALVWALRLRSGARACPHQHGQLEADAARDRAVGLAGEEQRTLEAARTHQLAVALLHIATLLARQLRTALVRELYALRGRRRRPEGIDEKGRRLVKGRISASGLELEAVQRQRLRACRRYADRRPASR
eukprot:7376631-Prymnesium_polylepis.1